MKKKALLNSLSSVILQIVTFVCGLIIPRLILETFGSNVNGSIQSITQFLNYIILLEAGVGGVVRAALYKPLAERNYTGLSGIVNATESFFKKICYIFIGYMLILATVYSYMVSDSFSYIYTFSLVIIIGLGTVAQYYFGITAQIFLTADQRGYVTVLLQAASIIVNSIFIFILIKLGMGIHTVKLFSAVIFVIRPMILQYYMRKKYAGLDKNIPANNDLIKQRWDGFGQHIAFFVHNNTDIVILTCFQNLKVVSVYSVYYMIVSGLQNLISCISAGFTPAIGQLIATENKNGAMKAVNMYEFLCFLLCNILMTVCGIMIVPFVSIYTRGITDINYIDYRFAVLIVLASVALLLRNVYQSIILSAGHYKQTNVSAYTETILNIGTSLCLVKKFGLSGVALGTFVSLVYRLVYYVIYLSKNILCRNVGLFIKRFCVNAAALAINLIIIIPNIGRYRIENYFVWAVCAAAVTVIVSAIVVIVNLVFYKNDFWELCYKLKCMRRKSA